MLSPFTLQLKEINGQQKAQGEIHPKDALMCPSQFANTAACLSFFWLFLNDRSPRETLQQCDRTKRHLWLGTRVGRKLHLDLTSWEKLISLSPATVICLSERSKNVSMRPVISPLVPTQALMKLKWNICLTCIWDPPEKRFQHSLQALSLSLSFPLEYFCFHFSSPIGSSYLLTLLDVIT